ncbi:MAG: cytochrome c3 family protein [SAR202 cluster bacterium]|nr:cytochrome c3 family protein [SAR202 cluster bacterium]
MITWGVFGLVGLFFTAVVVGVLMFVISAWLGKPLSVFGYNEGPDQPIAFPHTTHVQNLGLDCTFCHRNVEKGAAATIPPVGLCMTCHLMAGDGLAEVEKLRAVAVAGDSIDWVRVHRLPDHVHFNHSAHIVFFSRQDGIAPSAVCSTCHGDVGSMVKVEQARYLKMADCVNCHRDNNAPTDCVTCHY